ncbi:hypothetical protein L0222_02685 [bacterium]|nr:hypothetical protein [bacterium]
MLNDFSKLMPLFIIFMENHNQIQRRKQYREGFDFRVQRFTNEETKYTIEMVLQLTPV